MTSSLFVSDRELVLFGDTVTLLYCIFCTSETIHFFPCETSLSWPYSIAVHIIYIDKLLCVCSALVGYRKAIYYLIVQSTCKKRFLSRLSALNIIIYESCCLSLQQSLLAKRHWMGSDYVTRAK